MASMNSRTVAAGLANRLCVGADVDRPGCRAPSAAGRHAQRLEEREFDLDLLGMVAPISRRSRYGGSGPNVGS
jgi:hypothetical protein